MKISAYKKFIEGMKSYQYPKVAKVKRAATAKQLEALAKGRAFRSTKITNKYSQAWNAYQNWLKVNNKLIKDQGNVIQSFSRFELTMKADKSLQGLSIQKRLIKLTNDLKYRTNYKTAKRILKVFKESPEYQNLSPEAARAKMAEDFESIRQMTTRQLYDLHKDSIEAYKEELMKQNLSKREIAKMVSQYYFGS